MINKDVFYNHLSQSFVFHSIVYQLKANGLFEEFMKEWVEREEALLVETLDRFDFQSYMSDKKYDKGFDRVEAGRLIDSFEGEMLEMASFYDTGIGDIEIETDR
jgi:hypothetical protein